jgi:hypothetical protein
MNAVKEVEVPVGAEGVTADLELDPGRTIQVSVVDPGGKPAPGGFVARGAIAEKYVGWYGQKMDGATFEARSLAPGETRTLIILDENRKLGRTVRVKADEAPDGKVTVELQPLSEVTGRLLDADGNPLGNVSIEAEVGGRALMHVTTQSDGRFRYVLVPGGEYYLMVNSGPHVGGMVADHLTPEPGATKDLGDVTVKRQIGE